MEQIKNTRSKFEELEREQAKTEKIYLTRKQLKREFHLSYPSILKYEKEGKFSGYQIGHRILFDRSEIEASLIKRKFH